MARIRTRNRRRLAHLRRRREREKNVRTFARPASEYRFDASLRIVGIGSYHDEILIETGISPTRAHRKGEPRGRAAALGFWPEDLWCLESPLGERASLDQHLEWLRTTVEPHKAYFAELIANAAGADLCLGCDRTGVRGRSGSAGCHGCAGACLAYGWLSAPARRCRKPAR